MTEKQMWMFFTRSRPNSPNWLKWRNALVLMHKSKAEGAARRYAARLPVDYDDLYSAACIGLMQAVAGFKPERGYKFSAYAPGRIRGAILDYLREIDHLPRVARGRRTRALAAHDQACIDAGHHVPCDVMLDRTEQAPMSLDEVVFEKLNHQPATRHDFTPGHDPEPWEEASKHEGLRALLKGLNKIERLIMIGYYWEHLTMKEIGQSVGLSESRISQLHSQVIVRLQQRLGVEDECLIS